MVVTRKRVTEIMNGTKAYSFHFDLEVQKDKSSGKGSTLM